MFSAYRIIYERRRVLLREQNKEIILVIKPIFIHKQIAIFFRFGRRASRRGKRLISFQFLLLEDMRLCYESEILFWRVVDAIVIIVDLFLFDIEIGSLEWIHGENDTWAHSDEHWDCRDCICCWCESFNCCI